MKSKARNGRSGGSVHSDARTTGGERARNISGAGKPEPARHGGPKTWLYGVHPVIAAIANHRRHCLRLVMTPEAEASIGARIAQVGQGHPDGVPQPEIVSRETLDRLLPRGAVHQGVGALVAGLDDTDIDDNTGRSAAAANQSGGNRLSGQVHAKDDRSHMGLRHQQGECRRLQGLSKIDDG